MKKISHSTPVAQASSSGTTAASGDTPGHSPRRSAPVPGPPASVDRPPAHALQSMLKNQPRRRLAGNVMEIAAMQTMREGAGSPPSVAQLQQGRRALKKLDQASLGPLAAGKGTFGRKENDSAHGHTDLAARLRREIAEVQDDLAHPGTADAGGGTSRARQPQRPGRDYARASMDQWARRTMQVAAHHPEPAMAKAYAANVAYQLYQNWRSPEATHGAADAPKRGAADGVGHERAQHLTRALQGLVSHGRSDARRRSGVMVTQGADLLAPGKMAQDMFPAPPRRGKQPASAIDSMYLMQREAYMAGGKRLNPSGAMTRGRLTVNFVAADAKSFIQRMHEVTGREKEILQAKVPNLNQVGRRVDDGVVYLSVHKPVERDMARRVAADIAAYMPTSPVVPPGMEPMNGAVSYAETKVGDSTSHGQSRGDIVAATVAAKLNGDARPMSALMTQELVRGGYDPQMPSRVAGEASAAQKKSGGVAKSMFGKPNAR